MDFNSLTQAIALFLAFVLLYSLWRKKTYVASKNAMSPPEPLGAWPLVGHLPLLGGKNPVARTLAVMTDKYGPIFTIKLGVHRALVVSNWEAVKECFTKNDRAFAARPISRVAKYLGYNFAAFGFISYSPYWREMRKFAQIELLSSRRLDAHRHVRVSEVEMSIKELYSIAKRDYMVKIVISEWIEKLTLNIIARMIAGKRCFERTGAKKDEEASHFRKVVKEFMCISGAFVWSDAVPFPLQKWIDLQHLNSMKRISKELDNIIDRWVQEHIEKGIKKGEGEAEAGHEQDFIDVMLSVIDSESMYGHTKETIIKATTMNLILAGSDTTSTNLTWILSILLNHRHVLNHAQEEIDIKVGKDRWVEESDIKDLVYLQAIVKETLRLYPPGPLSVPHEAVEDLNVCGYHIPKGTRLLVNLWKMHRDPRVWSDPDTFTPERWFLKSHAEVDVSGQHFEFTPFGSGRRSCPGITFAMQVTHLTLARLLQGFDFTTPSNEPVDMTEGLGITLPKATPLEVFITPRLPSTLYEN